MPVPTTCALMVRVVIAFVCRLKIGIFLHMARQTEAALEELLRQSSEAFLSRACGSDQLKAMSQQKASGAFLLLFDSCDSLRSTLADCSDHGTVVDKQVRRPSKFCFMASEGIASLYQQMGLPPPPVISFDAAAQCVVVAVVCVNDQKEQSGDSEGHVYQSVFVYTY